MTGFFRPPRERPRGGWRRSSSRRSSSRRSGSRRGVSRRSGSRRGSSRRGDARPGRSWRAEIAATLLAGLDLAVPRTCPGCHAPVAWCAACASTVAGRPRAIDLPDPLIDRWASTGVPLVPLHALARYTGPIRAAILAGKEHGRRDLPRLLGAALGVGLVTLCESGAVPDEPWLVPAPTRRASARARGGDPVLAMARVAAATLADHGIATGVAPCLSLAARTRDSVGLDAAGRAANLAGAVRFDARASPPPGAATVILDDVLTSGATMLSSSGVLTSRALPVVGGLVLASVPALRPSVLGNGPSA